MPGFLPDGTNAFLRPSAGGETELTAAATLNAGDRILWTGTSAADLTLPSATGSGASIVVRADVDAATATVKRAGSDTIDGLTEKTVRAGQVAALRDSASGAWVTDDASGWEVWDPTAWTLSDPSSVLSGSVTIDADGWMSWPVSSAGVGVAVLGESSITWADQLVPLATQEPRALATLVEIDADSVADAYIRACFEQATYAQYWGAAGGGYRSSDSRWAKLYNDNFLTGFSGVTATTGGILRVHSLTLPQSTGSAAAPYSIGHAYAYQADGTLDGPVGAVTAGMTDACNWIPGTAGAGQAHRTVLLYTSGATTGTLKAWVRTQILPFSQALPFVVAP